MHGISGIFTWEHKQAPNSSGIQQAKPWAGSGCMKYARRGRTYLKKGTGSNLRH